MAGNWSCQFPWLPVAFIHCYQQGSSDALSHQNKPNAFYLSKNAFPTFKRHKNTDLSNMKWNFISSKKTKMLEATLQMPLPQEASGWDASCHPGWFQTLSHQTLLFTSTSLHYPLVSQSPRWGSLVDKVRLVLALWLPGSEKLVPCLPSGTSCPTKIHTNSIPQNTKLMLDS